MKQDTKEKLDTIGREEIIERLYTIIESVSKNKGNISFALDGLWGSGKTFVIDRLEEKLKSIQSEETETDRYFVIHYNCWQYDYYEEPLVAIVSAMLDELNNDHIIKSEKARITIREVFKKLGAALLFLGNAAVKQVTGIDVKDKISKALKEAKEVKQNTEGKYKEKHQYDEYFNFKKVLKELRKALNQLSQEYTLVFVVDELDRCLPEYSIKILERLHHLTEGITNTITIIATDKSKLEKTINAIYGLDNSEFDYCSKYLKKFISFSVKLDIGQSNDNIFEKYKEYFSLFNDDVFIRDNINFNEFFNSLFENIEVREQEILMNKILLVHKLINAEEKCGKHLMYLEMIFAITENYYKHHISKFFNGYNFEKYASRTNIIDLTGLNDVLQTSYSQFNQTRYIINEGSGIRGFISMILSDIREESSNNNPIIFSDGRIFDRVTKERVRKYIKKFRELMSIID